MKVVVVHILTQGLVTIPALLVECLRGHTEKWYGLEQDDRIFPYTKSIVNHVMLEPVMQLESRTAMQLDGLATND